ncbi:MAG: lipopolysaccharide transport periplasmic protein LptA [Thermodesulfobacteriota bacterium]|nr:lipopolysaccharide transport periplasmic protein LptA [Thermodesulfobacteriota bacterium]
MQFSYLRIFGFMIPALLFLGVYNYSSAANPDTPIHIEADRMESNSSKNIVEFTGNVEAKQGDLVINADKMTVYYQKSNAKKKSSSANSQKIKKIIADSNVTIARGELSAAGDRAEFSASNNKVTLIGNTRVWQDNNLVTGNMIEIDLDTGTSIVERSKNKGERVKGIFYPGSGGNPGKQE